MAHATRQLSPLDLLSRLPTDRPAYLLHSGERAAPFSRFSVLALPRVVYRFTDRSELIVLPGDDASSSERELREAAQRFTHDPLSDLDMMLRVTQRQANSEVSQPFTSGWIGSFSYELGAVIEPAARGRNGIALSGAWPLIEMGWCPRALVYDNVTREWMHVAGDAACASAFGDVGVETSDASRDEAWSAGALKPSVTRAQHVANVARTIEHIRAGDVFQANITQQFTAPFEGSTRSFAHAALKASGAWYGAMLECMDGRAIVSMSPELFLAVDGRSRRVMTRPIKGTRPRESDVRELAESDKDKAELAMIVDLMRNDLGRVCEIGSIRVTNPRTIETHGAVHQGVGEVVGDLRAEMSVGELLRASFPPGSVTGAPKIRAMQIIDDLEASPRGPYCGALGFVSDAGDITLNVAIRTVALQGTRPWNRFDALSGTLRYGAGGGIVVDSDPASEYEEALDKTQLLRHVLEQHRTAHTM